MQRRSAFPAASRSNDTLLGHVVQGIELLSALPRGPSPRGFYDKPQGHIPIRAMRVAADVPAVELREPGGEQMKAVPRTLET